MLTVSALALAAVLGGPAKPTLYAASPEGRAVAFLSREVPAWSVENKCYSCHNNGDAARALYAARRLGRPISEKALADTTRWVSNPGGWGNNGGDGEFNDRRLAYLQFAATLSEAKEVGQLRERQALDKAGGGVAALQDKDGAWSINTGGNVGEPATHGTALATFLARRTLQRLDEKKYAPAIARADAWARKTPIKTVLDAAAVLLLLERADDAEARAQRTRCLELIRKGESKDGGWGPFTSSPPEVFDTAVVVLALTRQTPTEESRAMIKRGRQYLIAAQQEDGSWKETTRPSGFVSYAQRLSTTGWATLALLTE